MEGCKSIFFNVFFLSLGWFVMDFALQTHHIYTGFSFPSEICDEKSSCSKEIFKKSAEADQKVQKIEKSFYRTYPYRPSHVDEETTRRWRLLTFKYNYEMINYEPRIGLNGMWRREVEQIDQFARNIISKSARVVNKNLEMKEIFRHDDPYQGVQYIINYKNKNGAGDVVTVELERNFVAGKPLLKQVVASGDGDVINVIMPLSKVTDRFTRFLDRLESSIIRQNPSGFRFIFVVFQPHRHDDDVIDDDVTIATVKQFHARNPHVDIRYKKIPDRDFNRALGLDEGVKLVEKDEIMLFLDVDLTITEEWFKRIRLNVIRNKRVLFPVIFSQFSPEIGEKSSHLYPPLKEELKRGNDVSENTGFWLHYAYGIVALYKSDYIKAGGFKTDIEGWGGEDVDFFKKVIALDDVEVMTSVDRDIMHIYHGRNCDVTLPDDQYMMCIGAWSETLASQLEAGLLYDENRK